MAYEPRGRVQGLLDLMRAAPERTWNTAEVAEVLQVMVAQVPSYLDAAVKHGAIHRGFVHGRLMYGMRPFPASGPAADARAPQVDAGWSPPKMAAPRPGSDVRHVNPPKPTDAPPPPPAPTPASTPAPLPPSDVQEEPSPEEEEVIEPNAFVDVGSGDVILIGCEVDEDGRVTVPSDLVRKIVGRMAWSPLR